MGCDIHIVLEHRAHACAEWIGQWCSDSLPGGRPLIARRNYEFFAEIAAVRGSTDTSVYPRNLPVDVSRLAWTRYMRHPTVHHSASHATLVEITSAWLRGWGEHPDVRADFAVWDLLKIDADDGGDHRVVFWFDN